MRKQCVYVSIIIIIIKNVRFSKGYNAIKVFMSLYKKDKATPPAAAWTLWKKAGIGGSNMCTHKPLETKMIPRSPQKPQCWYQKWWRKKTSTVSSSWRKWLENASLTFSVPDTLSVWCLATPKVWCFGFFWIHFHCWRRNIQTNCPMFVWNNFFNIKLLFIELLHKNAISSVMLLI